MNSDSTNQAVWNKGPEALKKKIITKKVRKSKIELTGPKKIMKFLMKVVFSRCGRRV